MMPAISVRHVWKRFSLQRGHGKLRASLEQRVREPLRRSANGKRGDDEKRWALRDMSFEVPRGASVALVGHNGAGKSVLLRVLARVTRPTLGEADLLGSVGAVLDVGVGFNRELTGRENIFLQGAILGIKKRELALKLDAIVELSGMQDFLLEPLKTYSNGMQVRLAFAVSAQLEPNILLMDEVLAVADEEFIRVCVDTLNGLKQRGCTILLASHDVAFLSRVCTHALWLEHGRLLAYGEIDEIADRYRAQAGASV